MGFNSGFKGLNPACNKILYGAFPLALGRHRG